MAVLVDALLLLYIGVHLIVIGVGRVVSKLELRGIASGLGDSNLHLVPTFDDLPGLLESLTKDLCNGKY